MSWLKFEKGCHAVLTGRTPRANGIPDVLGVTKNFYLLEIEIKRSISDLKADNDKPHIHARNLIGPQPEWSYHKPSRWPKQFWYCVPWDLALRAERIIPDWAGLLRGPTAQDVQRLSSVKPAPTLRESAKLTTKEVARLMHVMCNQIYSQAQKINALASREDSDWGLEYRI